MKRHPHITGAVLHKFIFKEEFLMKLKFMFILLIALVVLAFPACADENNVPLPSLSTSR